MSKLESHTITVILVTICACLAGCGANSTKPQRNQSPNNKNSVYIDYALPELEFEVKVTYQLRKCSNVDKFGSTKVDFNVKVDAELSPKISAAAVELRFDPTTLARKRQSQNATIDLYPNGTIKSINAATEDKTGSILSGVFKFAANLFKIGTLLGADQADTVVAVSKKACVQPIVDELKVVDDLVSILSTRETKLRDILEQDTPTEAMAKRVEVFKKIIAALKTEIADHRKKKLTISKIYTIKPNDLKSRQYLSLSSGELEKWLLVAAKTALTEQMRTDWYENGWGPLPAQPILALDLNLSATGSYVGVTADQAKIHNMLLIRPPISSSYELCSAPCVDSSETPTKTKRFARGETFIPQWAQIETIDFNVKTFDKRTLAMTFSEVGRVSKLAWQAPSRAGGAVTAIAGATEQVATFVDVAKYGREVAEIRALDKEISLYKKRVELKEAKEKFDEAFANDDDDATEEL